MNKLLLKATDYDSAKEQLKSGVLQDFKTRHDKCKLILSDGEIETSKGTALLNFILFGYYSGIPFKVSIAKSDIYLKSYIKQATLKNYFDSFLEKSEENHYDYSLYAQRIYNILNEIETLSDTTPVLYGVTIDYLDFVENEMQDPEAKRLFSCNLKYGMQFDQIESAWKTRGTELISYFNNHPERNLSIFTRCESGINAKQLTQTLSYVGLKPGMDTNVIPKVIEDNFYHGLTSMEDYLINAKGTRLALSTNHQMTPKSGYLTRKLSLANIDRWHDNSIEDCGTKHYVKYIVNSLAKLSLIEGRAYYDLNNGVADYAHLKIINSKKDIQLIGKTIALRSPTTCACKPHCCRTCYGPALSEKNKNLNTGLIAVFEITKTLTQRPLSAKHLLATNTDKINWGKDFTNTFAIDLDRIYFTDLVKSEISFEYPEEDDYDEDNKRYLIKEFDFKNQDNIKIHYASPVSLYVNELLIPEKKPDNGIVKVNSEEYGTTNDIFYFLPHNNMLTKSLQNILELIESKDHLGITNYDDLVNKFADLLIENNMTDVQSVHAEIIASGLIDGDINWKDDVVKPYKLIRVSQEVMQSPITVSMSFERLNDQLANIETYQKTDNSIMDAFFK